LPLDIVRFAFTQLAALPTVAGSQEADRQDIVCISRQRTNADAKLHAQRRLSPAHMSPG
jgi:hypothetical protein